MPTALPGLGSDVEVVDATVGRFTLIGHPNASSDNVSDAHEVLSRLLTVHSRSGALYIVNVYLVTNEFVRFRSNKMK